MSDAILGATWRCPDCGNDVKNNHRGCIMDMNALRVIRDLNGEIAVLVNILRSARSVISTIEGEDSDETQSLNDLCSAIGAAIDQHARHRYTSAFERRLLEIKHP